MFKSFIDRPNIKILAIADIHNYITDEQLEVLFNQKYDICLLLGDIGDRALKEIASVIDLDKTYGVLGNHDSFELYKQHGIKELSMEPSNLLKVSKNKKTISVKGLSGSRRYKPDNLPMLEPEESETLCSHENGLCDIFVTHDYPIGLYEWINPDDKAHSGLSGINRYLQHSKPPQLLIHGHLHDNTRRRYNRGIGYTKNGGTLIIGVFGCSIINFKTLKAKNLFQPY